MLLKEPPQDFLHSHCSSVGLLFRSNGECSGLEAETDLGAIKTRRGDQCCLSKYGLGLFEGQGQMCVVVESLARLTLVVSHSCLDNSAGAATVTQPSPNIHRAKSVTVGSQLDCVMFQLSRLLDAAKHRAPRFLHSMVSARCLNIE
jgi:hypothetical protein